MARTPPPPAPAPAAPAPEAGARAVRTYLAILLGAALALGLGLGLLAERLGPPVGDLTRISGRSERAFGWTGEKPGFAGTRYRAVALADLIAGRARPDIVVFGDSFSVPRETSSNWLDHLQAATGLEIGWVRIRDFRAPLAYFASEAFRRRPPRAAIVETVERELAMRARGVFAPGDCAPPPAFAPLTGTAPASPPPAVYRRRTTFESFDERMSWGALAARKRLSGGGPVLELALSTGELFSSAAADRLLLLENDVTLHAAAALGAPPRRAAREVVCGLRRLIGAGRGRALLAAAPDKRTIYAPWIAAPLPAKALDLFALTAEALGPAAIDLRAPLAAAAAAGARDVYWPNDTHWGAAGHRIAGETAARVLTGAASRSETK